MAKLRRAVDGGWPTLRGSCATTEIGVRLDARPRSLSEVLGSECANRTHDRVAEFANRLAKSLLVVRSHQGLLVVRLRHVRVAWVVRTVTAGSRHLRP